MQLQLMAEVEGVGCRYPRPSCCTRASPPCFDSTLRGLWYGRPGLHTPRRFRVVARAGARVKKVHLTSPFAIVERCLFHPKRHNSFLQQQRKHRAGLTTLHSSTTTTTNTPPSYLHPDTQVSIPTLAMPEH
ncbi:hypothetical protein E2C01_060455 [Portunus trituberculatus]|uniref:Uncharacterized protein n=1 Tax=Portunus trituberculatus TaxID=210409 RepID=A0A5B7HBG4_PORTR|nr:hypothetical protein [Portunus trituberculatus]